MVYGSYELRQRVTALKITFPRYDASKHRQAASTRTIYIMEGLAQPTNGVLTPLWKEQHNPL